MNKKGVPKELWEAFYAGQRSAEVPVVIDDVVEVVAGRHLGRYAASISLESVGPNASILVEFEDGSAAVLGMSDLRVVGNAG